MGNTKSHARGLSAARDGVPSGEDPFAELAEIFETELKFDQRFADDQAPRRSVATPTVRREPDLDLGGMERDFQKAFEVEMGGPRQSAGAKGAQYPQKGARAQPTHLTDEEIDHELESVLRNLSAPARPRGRIVVETQSFAPERAVEERVPHVPHQEVDEFEELIRSELAVIRPSMPIRQAAARRVEPEIQEAYSDEPHDAGRSYEVPLEDMAPVVHRGAWKLRMMMGASAAAILVVGGVGYLAMPGGSAGLSTGDEPLLIKADAEPYKVPPKDPGGRAYPNQNKAVYDRVASPNRNDDTPIQQALIKNAEEPMDLPAEEEASYTDNLPGVELGDQVGDDQKDETRVSEATETAEAGAPAALQPRKVKTMTVGSDGRLVTGEAPAAADAGTPAAPAMAMAAADAAQPAAPAAAAASDPLEVAAIAPLKPAAPVRESVPEAQPAPAPKPKAAAAAAAAAGRPEQAASAMPAGGYFVQVSSQPSEPAAQQSMRSFGSRYGSVVAGRPVGIQPAEIAGKGTFYRVRVAASSKGEAATLCSQLKSAGASCFVTR